MHVYTPPGYETSGRKYPVLYLLHGAGDSDHSWSTAGRAGLHPRQPDCQEVGRGHDRRHARRAHARAGRRRRGEPRMPTPPSPATSWGSVVPYIEQHYRVASGRENTRIAGLSMGGGQTLDIATANGAKFGYVGVFSSGLFGVFTGPGRACRRRAWSKARASGRSATPRRSPTSKTKKGLKLFCSPPGKDDFLLQTTRSTVNLFKEYGYSPVYKEAKAATRGSTGATTCRSSRRCFR
jgi:enterochelin esterase family protein